MPLMVNTDNDNGDEDWVGFFANAVQIVNAIILTPKPEPTSVKTHAMMSDNDGSPAQQQQQQQQQQQDMESSFQDNVVHINDSNMDPIIEPDTTMRKQSEDVIQQEGAIEPPQQQQHQQQ
jgi:hypothetical protein